VSLVGKLLSYIGLRTATRIAPSINLTESISYFQSVTAPNPGIKAIISDEVGALVGYASYGISPLFDRLYLYDFKIEPAMRRKGYGFQFLSDLVSRHGCPIVPVHETGSSHNFWMKARERMSANGDRILPSISAYELHQEHRRWPHLRPEIDKLNHVISARIMVEEWSIAVGRGVE
jgi:hypothetical protein